MVAPPGTTPGVSLGAGEDVAARRAALQRRTWRYWLERSAAAMGHGPPTGLYDPAVRRRFNALIGEGP